VLNEVISQNDSEPIKGDFSLKQIPLVFLGDPLPPMADWIEDCLGHLENIDFDTMIGEFSIISVILFMNKERLPSKLHPKNAKLLRNLAKVRASVKIIVENLPPLLNAAKADLSRPLDHSHIKTEDMRSKLESATADAHKELAEVELNLFLAARMMVAGKGFYGQARSGRHHEPWAGEAGLLYELCSRALAKSGAKSINRAGLHANSPLIQLIWRMLKWEGHGDRERNTIAQTIKRAKARSNPLKIDELIRIARAELVLLHKSF
jgi:hypothetical protein